MPYIRYAVPAELKGSNRPVGRRPNIRCRRPAEGQELPPVGTVVEASGGAVIVFVGDQWPDDRIDLPRLATRLRTARSVDLIGDVWQAARPLKFALRQEWTAATKAARVAARPPVVPKPPAQRCGRPRRDGKPCRAFAGAGSDHPGKGPCAHHGGSTVVKDEQQRRLAEQVATAARLARKARIEPLTRREQLEGGIALAEVLIEVRKRQRRRSPY